MVGCFGDADFTKTKKQGLVQSFNENNTHTHKVAGK